MNMKAIYLTEDDARVLRQIVHEFRERNQSLPSSEPTHPYGTEESSGTPSDDIFTPEVYVVEVPDDGIPGMSKVGDKYVPGKAECKVHRLRPLTGELTGTGTGTGEDKEYLDGLHFKVLAHNLGDRIEGGGLETGTGTVNGTSEFRLAWRTKYGRWFIDQAIQLYEFCLQEDHPGRGVVFEVKLGKWDSDSHSWCFEGDNEKAIDWRYDVPYPGAGSRGQGYFLPSKEYDRILIPIDMDCSSPGACPECEEES